MSSALYTNFDFNKNHEKKKSYNVNLALKLIQQRNMIIQQKNNKIKKLNNSLRQEEEHKEENKEEHKEETNGLTPSLENNNSSILIDNNFITFF